MRWAVEEGVKPGVEVEVALVPDEEAGGVGTRYLVESGYVKAGHVVVCEPTTPSRVVIGHKGLVRGVVRVFGRQAHSSTPWRGENAFLRAAALALEFLESYEPLLAERGTRWPIESPEEAHPTISLGGYAESLSRKDNVIPGEFVFSFDRRVLPEEDAGAVVEELVSCIEAVAKRVSAKCKVEGLASIPASTTPLDAPIVRMAGECLREAGYSPSLVIKSGRTDAVYYVSRLGSEAVCLGPGVDGAAHAPDEFNEVGQVSLFIAVYKLLIERFGEYASRL